MTLDYVSLRAVSTVVQTGSFEKAARLLNVTPSAVSQRVKLLEERLGTALVIRGSPCIATEKGAWLCRHMETVGMLESELLTHLPALVDPLSPGARVTLHIATNADSLATWFLTAAAAFSHDAPHLLGIAVDDQDHTAEWLQQGRVLAAVTSLESPISGCRRTPLGALRYRATASPDFVALYFADGMTPFAFTQAPSLTFNQKDRLQSRWLRQTLGEDPVCPTHWLPATQSFVEASLLGMGWGMNPEILVAEHLASGRLIELIADTPLDIPLFWQIHRLAADQLTALTRAVVDAAHKALHGHAQTERS
ncbi:LysR family transcriptional regulator (chromosome initiation inhibitor) [Rhizobium sp. PP-F2F-G48]|uniref:LysR family transcriptional regulator ArgP n=1 Tax=Rhizobium sp. PP-F2F-G48 TaxID=2135651 RepID=UPI0010508C98|nr:LysR family transcriptional regulator ArgP [Rhizobium sp. PP-F2F-G48]TCM57716.1 LysR family transcriptional regulator (chromosome initiation inhibitor) [Rhizobium sp. PP-F2F-G48]